MPRETQRNRASRPRLGPTHNARAAYQSEKFYKDPGTSGAKELVAQGPAAAGTALPGAALGTAWRVVRHCARYGRHAAPERVQAAVRQRVLHVHGIEHLVSLVIRLVHLRVR